MQNALSFREGNVMCELVKPHTERELPILSDAMPAL
jgi:hypothetical protein